MIMDNLEFSKRKENLSLSLSRLLLEQVLFCDVLLLYVCMRIEVLKMMILLLLWIHEETKTSIFFIRKSLSLSLSRIEIQY